MTCLSLGGMGWSSVTQQVFYGDQLGCKSGFYLFSADGTVRQLPTPALRGPEQMQDHTLSSTGDAIAFVHGERDAADKLHENVYVLDVASGRSTRVTNLPPGRAYSPTWTPDGRAFAFIYRESTGNDKQFTVYMAQRDGSNLHALLDNTSPGLKQDVGSKIAWSPDGRTLGFIAPATDKSKQRPNTNDTFRSVWLMDSQNGAQRELHPDVPANAASGIDDFAWSPDGKQLALVAGYHGVCRPVVQTGGEICSRFVYRMDADGKNLTKLTKTDHVQTMAMEWLR